MAKEKTGLTDIIELAWLKKEFDNLRRDHVIIIEKLDRLHEEHLLILKKLGAVSEFVSPELQEQIILTARLALGIDLKVPDQVL
jgi:serine/threonine-protein kinase RIO1